MCMAQNDVPKAIHKLRTYLETYQCDHEAWMQLAELYVAERECVFGEIGRRGERGEGESGGVQRGARCT